MEIALLGGGSIGLLFAARLSFLTNETVYLITRTKEQKDLLNTYNLQLRELNGNEHRVHVESYSQLDEGKPVDWVFLMVKQTDMNGIEEIIGKWMNEKTKLICFQNGLGHIEYLKNRIQNPIYLAITTEAAKRTDLNSVIHTGNGDVWIGCEDGSCGESVEYLLFSLRKAGFHAEYSENIMEMVWHKLIMNAVINPITALYEVKNGALVHNQELWSLAKEMLMEIIEVMSAAKMKVSNNIESAIERVCLHTKNNESSMLQDLRKGRFTEINSIVMPIIGLGRKHNIPTPLLERMTSLIHTKENKLLKRKG